MLDPSPCVGSGCEPLLEALGMYFSPVIVVNAFMEALAIGVGLAVVAGAVYAVVVFAGGGHVGALWMGDAGAPVLWRVRWLTLANSGYLLGLATFAALALPSPAILALVGVVLSAALVALNVVTERLSTSVGLEWMPVGTVVLFLALSAHLLAQAPALTVSVAVVWTLGAVLSALEVPVAVRRMRAVGAR